MRCIMKYLDKKFSVNMGNNSDICKCFNGEKCQNYEIKCNVCERIQGKYTEFKEK